MPVWGCLAATLGLNYLRHRQHRSTLCSFGRKFIGPRTFIFGWSCLTAWIVPHFCRPFWAARKNGGFE